MGLQLGLLWDLKRSIQKPFESAQYRHKFILAVCPIFFVIIFIYNLVKIHTNEIIGSYNWAIIGPKGSMNYSGYRYNLYTIPYDGLVIMILILGSIRTSIFAIMSLTRKGINQEFRWTILSRLIMYQIIMVACNSFYYLDHINKFISVFYGEQFSVKYFPQEGDMAYYWNEDLKDVD